MASDLPIFIPARVVEEYFNCSICLNTMVEPNMTACGHRFCSKCITEWVDRHRSCPCCNGVLDSTRLFRDHQFDGLIDVCKKEIQNAESAYFDSLLKPDQHMPPATPVEEVLRKHLKSSLAAHERYFQDLKQQFERKSQCLEFKMRKDLERLRLDGTPPAVLQLEIQNLEDALQEKKEALESDLQNCLKLVAEAYDRYLSEHIPSLDILPVKVTVVINDKGIRLPDIGLSPADTLTVIQTAVEEMLKQRGNEVIRWQPDGGKILLVSPLSKQESYNVPEILLDISMGGDSFPGIQQLSWLDKPVLQYHTKSGSELILHGCMVCQSDLPKVCYVQTYKQQGPKKVDYYSCSQCGFNWICKSCIQVCHKDHPVTPHVLNHQPTWACCYCPKKKTCHLLLT
ncbi:E3 ubiquitin-protein ligase TRIM21-like [Pomacea canaliculata]|uniref:E3 ubiquitin-protein ligase TRIM21-like n=1 Tax=Pomacea canaliculata TaxID=400727 RepID=UPI000D72F64C|nr:E3 ubiquitin-protein ligase TRIM21-like [Pomacea canaliculata]